MIQDWALELLRCPSCGRQVESTGDALRCPDGHEWPIRQGVGVFVPDQDYSSSFGFQWNRFDKVQLDHPGDAESEETFAQKTGLRPEDVKDRTVLDVGCGMGRFSDVVSRWGARVVGLDLSDAVYAAGRNLADRDNVTILQADVFDLPLRDASFDIAFSIGVLHHTPDTRRAFMQIPRVVKPGGMLAIWVYSRQLRYIHFGSELLRPLTSRMDPQKLLRVIERVMPALHRVHTTPLIGLPSRALLPASAHPDPEWRVLDTFDWYSPRYQHKHTYDEVTRWFGEAGLGDVQRGPFPVSVRGVRAG